MRILLFILSLLSVVLSAQELPTPPQKDPFLQNPVSGNAPAASPENKVRIRHADQIKKDTKYDGNRYLVGNVAIEHQGSVLYADEVVLYDAENFVRAIGNVKLQNADGSVITAAEMEYDGNTQRGVAQKNVVLNDPKGTTIRTQTMYYDRLSNQAYYNTGGTISDGKSTTYSKTGTYDLASRTINLNQNVKIEDREYTLEGPNLIQNQNTNIVDITGPTTIINKKNPGNRIYTEKGTHNLSTKESFLTKNSRIYYNGKILSGDKMYYHQIRGFGTATGNVLLDDPNEKRYLKGGYGEIYQLKDSAMVTNSPYAVKILENDSIYFAAEKILSYQKTDAQSIKKSYLRAFKKARIYKSDAQGRADSIAFNETDGVMHMYTKPILWSGERQVSGDKIEAYFNTETENIDSLKVIGNGMAISKVDSVNLLDEFNQVKGKTMNVYYEQEKIKEIKVIGNAQAITYADDVNERTKETERLGITLSTCGIIGAYFEGDALQIISCSIGADANTYPMSLISPEEKKFPDFNWNTKDRIRKWEDILVDSPNYEEIKYTANDALYNRIQAEAERKKAIEEAKKPKRVRR